MQCLIFMKLGMWVLLGTSVTHAVCCHQIHINSSFAYLFRLADNNNNNKVNNPEFCMGYSDETWFVDSSALKYYPCVLLLLLICILST